MTHDPSLLINILAPEPKTMKIPTKTLTLDIETSMTSAGLAILAEQLRALGAAHTSVQHGATLASIAGALDEQSARSEAESNVAADRQAAHDQARCRRDSRNAFVVAAGRAFRLSTPDREDAKIMTSRAMGQAARALGYTFERTRWSGQTWIVVPSEWRERAIAAEAHRNERKATP